ncbi:hypothetical protein ABT299_44965 [Spirillospora sp. NPDC000708]|uniref:Uncharacterized protein n=1 Tax=Actinomadura montaniterrae TaxID=1803903 RepID=A0A6L3VPU9_9ACTN|nr:hypothetical protein [Actinomadura montaniterrae]KAB2376992.1 hypothetical protein F9B16_24470 [Actinomadura montaniterrae]
MVQLRIMHSDPDRVREVAELLLPLMRASGLLHVGDETELPNRRDGGLRVVVEVTPAGPPVRVRADAGDASSSSTPRRSPRPGLSPGGRALPPARARLDPGP